MLVKTFLRDDEVSILDRPMGHRSRLYGRIVGVISEDFYNVLMLNGLQEGNIVGYRSWSLELKDPPKTDFDPNE